jgi:hypothetical protein
MAYGIPNGAANAGIAISNGPPIGMLAGCSMTPVTIEEQSGQNIEA